MSDPSNPDSDLTGSVQNLATAVQSLVTATNYKRVELDTAVASATKAVSDVQALLAGGVGSNANTDNLPEGTVHLYHTDPRVRATALTGLSTASATPVTATDTVLTAAGKLQAQASAASTALAVAAKGTVLVTASRNITAADAGKVLEVNNTTFTLTLPVGLDSTSFQCVLLLSVAATLATDGVAKINGAITSVSLNPGVYTIIGLNSATNSYVLDSPAGGLNSADVLAIKNSTTITSISTATTITSSMVNSLIICHSNPTLTINMGLGSTFNIKEIRGIFKLAGTAAINDARVVTTGSPKAQLIPTDIPDTYDLTGSVYVIPNWTEPLTIQSYVSTMKWGTQCGQYLDQPYDGYNPPYTLGYVRQAMAGAPIPLTQAGNWAVSYTTDSDMAIMVEQGSFDHFRIPCAIPQWADANNVIAEPYFQLIDQLVDWALQRFPRVILDPFHTAAEWMGQANASLWMNYANTVTFTEAQHIARANILWTTIATRYANRSLRLSFDLINEPSLAGVMTLAGVNSWYTQVIPLIRATGGNNAQRVIWMEAFNGDYRTVPPSTTINDGNVGVSPHYYTINAQGSSPLAAAEYTTTVQYLKDAAIWGAANNYAIWVGECGIRITQTEADRQEYLTFLRQLCYSQSVPVTMWCWTTDFGVYKMNTTRSDLAALSPVRTWWTNMQKVCSGVGNTTAIRNYPTPTFVTLNSALGGVVTYPGSVANPRMTWDPVTGRYTAPIDAPNGYGDSLGVTYTGVEITPGDQFLVRSVVGTSTGVGMSVQFGVAYFVPYVYTGNTGSWTFTGSRGRWYNTVTLSGSGILGNGTAIRMANDANIPIKMPTSWTFPSWVPPGTKLYLTVAGRQEGQGGTVSVTSGIEKAGSAILEIARVTTSYPANTQVLISNAPITVGGYPITIVT